MGKNKTGKYLLYAFGEIMLVVIGILIAIQINNWNQNQQLKKTEISILKTLTIEFETNKNLIQICHKSVLVGIKFADSLKKHIGPEPSSLPIKELYFLFGEIGSAEKCRISIALLEDFKNSGKINLISNELVRKNISLWFAYVKELKKEEDEWSQEFSNQFIPYTNKWIQWEDVDYYFFPDDSGYIKSRFNIDPRLILKNPEFANIMSIHYWRMKRIERRTDKLLKHTIELLELIKKNLKNNESTTKYKIN